MARERRKKKPESEEGPELSDLIGGRLNLFGVQIDLGDLLRSPDELEERLEELRQRLKQVGGKEVLSDEAWQQGKASVSGYIRTRGLLGEGEFHIGSTGRRGATAGRAERRTRREDDLAEPTLDVFDEGEEIVIVADVPGVALEDLQIKVEDGVLSLATKPEARRSYRKAFRLEAEVVSEGLKSTCHNGVLEVRVPKRRAK